MTFILFALKVLGWLFCIGLGAAGVLAIVDVLRNDPKLPDPILALINFVGYLAMIALAAICFLTLT